MTKSNNNALAQAAKSLGVDESKLAEVLKALGGGTESKLGKVGDDRTPFRRKVLTGNGLLVGDSGTIVFQGSSGGFYPAQALDMLERAAQVVVLIAAGEGPTRDRPEAGVKSTVKALSYDDITGKGAKGEDVTIKGSDLKALCQGVANNEAVQKAAKALSKALREAAAELQG